MIVAVTREVSPAIGQCELTHLDRVLIDIGRARTQHAAYEDALRGLDVTVERAEPAPEMADAVFVEDVAVVMPEMAVTTRPGAESRRAEVAGVSTVLEKYRHIEPIREGTLDGGDVLRIGKRIYVGTTSRTDLAGIAELRRIVTPFGYTVAAVEVNGCLHLKSAVTQVGETLVLVNPKWVNASAFNAESIEIDPREPWAANGLLVHDRVIFPEHFPYTRQRLERRGIHVIPVPCDELAKAEGAVTCCSILLETGNG